MKGYLFGLGAMVVGAGLMFVLMHGGGGQNNYLYKLSNSIL